MALPQASDWTVAEYLAFERESDVKHEFIGGQVVAMSGASREHNLIVASTIAALIPLARKQSCKVFPSDMRVFTPLTDTYTYPDVTVVCGDENYTDDSSDTLTNPTIIIEVLSDSTESYDRGKKFQSYRQIPSLKVYLLISQDQARIEKYTRQTSHEWLLTEVIGLGSTLELPELKGSLTINAIYEQITFDEKKSEDNA